MIIDFSLLDLHDRCTLILRNASGAPLGVLMNVMNVEPELLYNEVSALTFDIPSRVDGVETPFYDDVIGMRIIDLQGIGQFVLMNPKESYDGVTYTKNCKAYSLEYEFTTKKITLPKGTYKFYDEVDRDKTLLGMLLEDMPDWHIGTVPVSIRNKYRTFEVNNENIYNFIKGTVQKSYGCIFNFDTYTRTIYIDDANRTPDDRAVFISYQNLATEIEVEELTEDIVTRLDVCGGEGVTIRDVNPNGTNKIINLDYYMTEENFSQELIDKYYAWRDLNAQNRNIFYRYSVRYTSAVEQRVAEEARLADLQGEMTTLETMQGTIIAAMAQGLKTQSDLTEINADIAAKQLEINQCKALIETLKKNAEGTFEYMTDIVDACSYNKYFTKDERIQLARYIRDGEVMDSTFATSTSSFVTTDKTEALVSTHFAVNGSVITVTSTGLGTIYDMSGGTFDMPDGSQANIVNGTIDCLKDDTFVASFYLTDMTYFGEVYPQACITLTGTRGAVAVNAALTSMNFPATNVRRYFTLNVGEYERRSIAWELFNYGVATLDKLSKPSYQFSVTSANFLAHDAFTSFKNALRLGERIYLELKPDEVITPVCTGVTFVFGDPDSLKLLFSDRYVSGSGGNALVDLLEQSVSMGKTLAANQSLYSQFTDTGANTYIAQFMTSALDVSKNAIMSSTGNAISWDGSGLRLRKWADAAQTRYDPEQTWLINNSIMMTADNWDTAQMAIGKFSDENLGDCWGIVAPMVVGTLLAGSSLVIESEKKDGETSVFRVDENGARLYNSDFMIASAGSRILLNPDAGMVIGPTDCYTRDEDGKYNIDADKANFYVDDEGNVFLRGAVTATELHIGNKTIEEYVGENASGSYYQPEAPTSGYRVGAIWRDSDSPYGYLYTAISTTGDPAVDWVPVSSELLEGAAINTNANAGTIDIAAASTLTLASGGQLNIAGTGAINLASSGGINLNAGMITLGSIANTISSSGVLSLANGNIILNGPTNTVTVGHGGGTVNIGTDGIGTINLATYQVKSSTTTASYSTMYSTGGKSTDVDAISEFAYTATDESGQQTSTTFTITTTYTKAELSTNAPPSIVNGRRLQIVNKDRGINVYADTQYDTMILAPSVYDGNLMDWNLINARNISATNVSAATIVADSMYLPGEDGDIVAVADQKWTIDKVVEILNNNNVIPSLKSRIDNAYWKANNHSHTLTVSESGTVTIGKTTTVGGSGTNFNMADTTWYKNRVSAFIEAVRTGLASGSWGGSGTPSIGYTISATASTREVILTPMSAVANFVFPGDTGATQVSIGLPALNLTQDLAAYSEALYNRGYSFGEGDGYELGYNDAKPTGLSVKSVSKSSSTSLRVNVEVLNFDESGHTFYITVNAGTIYEGAYKDGYDDGYAIGYADGVEDA